MDNSVPGRNKKAANYFFAVPAFPNPVSTRRRPANPLHLAGPYTLYKLIQPQFCNWGWMMEILFLENGFPNNGELFHFDIALNFVEPAGSMVPAAQTKGKASGNGDHRDNSGEQGLHKC